LSVAEENFAHLGQSEIANGGVRMDYDSNINITAALGDDGLQQA
jgi:hypothetical protein